MRARHPTVGQPTGIFQQLGAIFGTLFTKRMVNATFLELQTRFDMFRSFNPTVLTLPKIIKLIQKQPLLMYINNLKKNCKLNEFWKSRNMVCDKKIFVNAKTAILFLLIRFALRNYFHKGTLFLWQTVH